MICGPRIQPGEEEAIENLAHYIILASFSQERMTQNARPCLFISYFDILCESYQEKYQYYCYEYWLLKGRKTLGLYYKSRVNFNLERLKALANV